MFGKRRLRVALQKLGNAGARLQHQLVEAAGRFALKQCGPPVGDGNGQIVRPIDDMIGDTLQRASFAQQHSRGLCGQCWSLLRLMLWISITRCHCAPGLFAPFLGMLSENARNFSFKIPMIAELSGPPNVM